MADKNRKRPLTIPTQVENVDGIDWLSFVYTAKGVSTDYRIRIDTNTVNVDELDTDFKQINSVYPKAFVPKEEYAGNRWDYETTVNEIGWKLCYLNQDILVGKRGLLQRAVDSKSRRVARVEKSQTEITQKKVKQKKKNLKVTLRPSIEEDVFDLIQAAQEQEQLFVKQEQKIQVSSPRATFSAINLPHYTLSTLQPSSTSRLIVETVKNKQPYQLRLRMDIDSIPDDVDRQFIVSNQPFFNPKTHQQYLCNSIAWKLAYLNQDILDGNLELLQRAVDVYMLQYEDPIYAPRAGKRLMQTVFPEHTES